MQVKFDKSSLLIHNNTNCKTLFSSSAAYFLRVIQFYANLVQ